MKTQPRKNCSASWLTSIVAEKAKSNFLNSFKRLKGNDQGLSIQRRKQRSVCRNFSSFRDLLVYAFVALGGGRDGTGHINNAEFQRVVREVYGLAIKTDRLVEELDINKNGKLNFTEFKALFF